MRKLTRQEAVAFKIQAAQAYGRALARLNDMPEHQMFKSMGSNQLFRDYYYLLSFINENTER